MGCRVTDFELSRLLRSVDSPPFIGLAPLPTKSRERAFTKTREFLAGDPTRLPRLFQQFPYVAAWCVAQPLNDGYGDDDDRAVYRHIEGVLGVALDTPGIRRTLFDGFCRVCDKLGARSRGFRRMVDVYLLQAGVPVAQLPHLLDAFLRQEAAFGPPPTEATALLNRWEDDALEFMPETVVIPRRAILWDETAWHAALYARIRRVPSEFKPAHEFEEQFAEILQKRADVKSAETGGTTGGQTLARPRLVWRDSGVALRLPRAVGRIQLWQEAADRPLRLRGGEDWTLPQPWPRQLRWQIGNQTGEVRFIEMDGGLAIFDRATGHLAAEVRDTRRELAVDAVDVVILSREGFSIDGEAALEVGTSSFVAFAQLRSQPATIAFGKREIALRALSRRRLTMHGGAIATGPKGPLYGDAALLKVETGLGRSEARQIRITSAGESTVVEVEIGADGTGEHALADLLSRLPAGKQSDPLCLRIELMTPTERGMEGRSAGVSSEVYCWPGFRGVDGIVFDSDLPPKNLVIDQSRHVTRDDAGRVCLDPGGGYIAARATFEIDGAFVPFDLPWPDVSIVRRRGDGTSSALPLGTRLSIGEEDRYDMVTVRCPDSGAELIVRGRHQARPFAHGLACHIAVLDLLTPSNDQRVVLRRSSGSELLLFELVPSLAPQDLQVYSSRSMIRLRLALRQPMDAIALNLEDEQGATELVEVALGRRPVSTPKPRWLSADLVEGNPKIVELAIGLDAFEGAPTLARILVRLDMAAGMESWRPLRNGRGDSYAIALQSPYESSASVDKDLQRRFEILCRWLADCYAPECWPQLESVLMRRWRTLGKFLAGQPGGLGALMLAAAVPPPEHTATSWVPIAHPLQIVPELYGAPISDFAGLATSSEPGIAEMSSLFSLSSTGTPDLARLHFTVWLAFRNAGQADSNGVPEGFEPKRFLAKLSLFDSDPSSGWFWRGETLLGPDHRRAAHLRFKERLETAGLFTNEVAGEGPNSQRQDALQRLMLAVFSATPADLRPGVPRRSAGEGEPDSIELWAASTLSGLARASRMGGVGEFVASASAQLGRKEADVLTTLAFLLRLAPELFAYFLLLWQLAKDRP